MSDTQPAAGNDNNAADVIVRGSRFAALVGELSERLPGCCDDVWDRFTSGDDVSEHRFGFIKLAASGGEAGDPEQRPSPSEEVAQPVL